MKSPGRLIIHSGLLLVAILYGANYSIAKIVSPQYMDALGFIIYRIFFAGIFFWVFSIGGKEKVDWKTDGWRFFIAALTGVAANQLLFFKGISLTAAINGSIIMTLTPVFVFVFSALLLKERIHNLKIIGLVSSFMGALIIIYKPGSSVVVGNWLGDILILLNSLSYGLYLVIVKPLMNKYSARTVTKWIFPIGLLLALPIGGKQAFSTDFSAFTMEAWISGIYVIIAVTVIAYIVNAWSMKRVNPTLVGVYIYLQPLIASIVAILFFNEKLTQLHIISAILIFSGIYLVNKKRKTT